MERQVDFLENPGHELLDARRARMTAVAAAIRDTRAQQDTAEAVLDALESGSASNLTAQEVARKLDDED